MSLRVERVTRTFGPILALDGVSFEVEPGRIFGLPGTKLRSAWKAVRVNR